MNASTSISKKREAGSGRGKAAGKAQTLEGPSGHTGNAPEGSKTRAKHRPSPWRTALDGPMAEETRRKGGEPETRRTTLRSRPGNT